MITTNGPASALTGCDALGESPTHQGWSMCWAGHSAKSTPGMGILSSGMGVTARTLRFKCHVHLQMGLRGGLRARQRVALGGWVRGWAVMCRISNPRIFVSIWSIVQFRTHGFVYCYELVLYWHISESLNEKQPQNAVIQYLYPGGKYIFRFWWPLYSL